MTGLAEYMQHKLEIDSASVGVFDCSRFLGLDEDEDGHGFELSVASGLALRSVMKAS